MSSATTLSRPTTSVIDPEKWQVISRAADSIKIASHRILLVSLAAGFLTSLPHNYIHPQILEPPNLFVHAANYAVPSLALSEKGDPPPERRLLFCVSAFSHVLLGAHQDPRTLPLFILQILVEQPPFFLFVFGLGFKIPTMTISRLSSTDIVILNYFPLVLHSFAQLILEDSQTLHSCSSSHRSPTRGPDNNSRKPGILGVDSQSAASSPFKRALCSFVMSRIRTSSQTSPVASSSGGSSSINRQLGRYAVAAYVATQNPAERFAVTGQPTRSSGSIERQLSAWDRAWSQASSGRR
ncbi:hypothetical protein SODALDRAFT_374741 [Sodiomyces alkalinus F11]|uniref:Uncharacterized protein n=1 Tax=Sodiomyces alkalinus (strain CBS 110278 / VKM F-3762 / F11) TaxID=1314773 RepID=A0A3N2Q6N0_SODAK|nr:hypothetical protein SODALDRAFT_374741 [Sodiomyces alkalinus F11]ROT42402.1 hypothetical protein SODALDRAFT_374741 [Sodiomyces alkalinus F11]